MSMAVWVAFTQFYIDTNTAFPTTSCNLQLRTHGVFVNPRLVCCVGLCTQQIGRAAIIISATNEQPEFQTLQEFDECSMHHDLNFPIKLESLGIAPSVHSST